MESRRAFLGEAVGLAALTVPFMTGCSQNKQSPQQIVEELTTSETLCAVAAEDLSIPKDKLQTILADGGKSAQLVLQNYGMLLLLEEVEGTNRPLKSMLVRVVVDGDTLRESASIQQLSSAKASQSFKEFKTYCEQEKEDTGFWKRFSSDYSSVQSAGDALENLALKLDNYPHFSLKNSTLSSIANIASGAPTASDFQVAKKKLAAVIRAL